VSEIEGGDASRRSRERYKGRSERWYVAGALGEGEEEEGGGDERVGGVVERSKKRSYTACERKMASEVAELSDQVSWLAADSLATHPPPRSFSSVRSIRPTLPSQTPVPPIDAGANAIAAIHQANAPTGRRGG
jgi:hypothetical protein